MAPRSGKQLATSIGSASADNMVFTQGRGFVVGASFGLPHLPLRCRVLACHAADTASLATWFLFGKLFGVATLVGFGEKQCRKNRPLAARPTLLRGPSSFWFLQLSSSSAYQQSNLPAHVWRPSTTGNVSITPSTLNGLLFRVSLS